MSVVAATSCLAWKLPAVAVAIACVLACGSRSDLQSRASAVGFCARLTPQPLFCDDFDEGTLTKWSGATLVVGDLALTNASSTSTPSALAASVGAGAANAHEKKSFDGRAGFSHATISFWMRTDPTCFTESTQANGVSIASITWDSSPGSGASLVLDVTETVTTIVYEPPARPSGITRASYTYAVNGASSDAWTRVVLDLDVARNQLSTVVGDVTTTTALAVTPGTINNPVVTLGLDATAAHITTCSAMFDDYVFDAR